MTGEELLTKIILNTAGQQDFLEYSKDLSSIAALLKLNKDLLDSFGMFYEVFNRLVGTEFKLSEVDILTKGSTSMTYELRVINPSESLFYEVL